MKNSKIYDSDIDTLSLEHIYTYVRSDLSNRIIELDPKYQRSVIWTDDDKRSFIESLYIGFAPSIIIFNIDDKNEKKEKLTCIDGKQRITSICNFIDNEFSIKLGNKNIYFEEFTTDEKTNFKRKKIHVHKYYNLKYSEQVTLFSKIQKGKPLSNGEKVQSYICEDLNDAFTRLEKKYVSYLSIFIKEERRTQFDFLSKLYYNIFYDTKNVVTEIKKVCKSSKDDDHEKNIKKLEKFLDKYLNIVAKNSKKRMRIHEFQSILYSLYINKDILVDLVENDIKAIVKRFADEQENEENIDSTKSTKKGFELRLANITKIIKNKNKQKKKIVKEKVKSKIPIKKK